MGYDVTIGEIEGRFADIIWERAPVSSTELVKIAAQEFSWARTTTHTVIRKLCDKGLFERGERGIVTVVIPREEFYARQGKQLVNTGYGGSLPLFVAGFVKNRKLTKQEVDEIIGLLKKTQ